MSWLWDNLSSLALALILALTVWVAAVLDEDPLETGNIPDPVPINFVNLPEGLLIVNDPPDNGQVAVRAPQSVWQTLNVDDVNLTVDLSEITPGTHQVQVSPEIEVKMARIVDHTPGQITLEVEAASSKTLRVNVSAVGEPAPGYRVARVQASPERVIVVGPASRVAQVVELNAEINVTNHRQDLEEEIRITPLNQDKEPIEGVTLEVDTVNVSVSIEELERYRLIAVVPVIEGKEQLEEAGYRLTNVDVSPTTVLVFSSDPQPLEEMSGVVETAPLNVANATGDLERRLSLNLPEDVSLVGDQSVLVQVSIEPTEGSITITRPIEHQGLARGLYVQLSPPMVDIILNGPIPTLRSLEEEDVRVVVDLLDLGVGTHRVMPEVIVAPTDVTHEPIFPEFIEVTITRTPPPTPTPTAGP